ncbi:MAG: type II toxin-antitoxin system Phd/YefM family antitoxin [Gloeotrichia echinulata GP01]
MGERRAKGISEFQRNTKYYVQQLQKTHKPLVLTVNGEAALVIQDAESYQQLLDELELARSLVAMKKSQEEFATGKDRDSLNSLLGK